MIGGITILKNWMLRSEVSNALPKLFVKNLTTNIEEELIFCDEKVYSPGISLMQKNRNTNKFILNMILLNHTARSINTILNLKKRNLLKSR